MANCGCGSVPVLFANIGEVERRRAVVNARLRIDLFIGMRLLRAQNCAVTG
jgi:hypothetical protein